MMDAVIQAVARPEQAAPLSSRVRGCGERVRAALRRVVDQVPVAGQRPMEHARVLGVHRTLAGRVLKALRTDDPLASIIELPRSEGLRIFLDALGPRVEPGALAAARAAVEELDALVRGELGGWDELDAAIGAWLPEAREKFELANRQQVYKGMSALFGARANVQLITAIYYPDETGERCHVAVLMGLLGLRRTRPGTRITVSSTGPSPDEPVPLARFGRSPADGAAAIGDDGPLLAPFCSEPLPALEAAEAGGATEYILAGDAIGASSEVDIVTAHVGRGVRPVAPPDSGPGSRMSGSAGVTIPSRTLLLNVLLHDDVWAGRTPELMVYDTRMRGLANPSDPDRQTDRMETMDSIQPLGRGAGRFHAPEVGRHAEMIARACEGLGWDPEKLRGFRCRAPFPLLHAQYCMVF